MLLRDATKGPESLPSMPEDEESEKLALQVNELLAIDDILGLRC